MKKILLSCLTVFCALLAQAQKPVPPTYKIDSQDVNLKKVYLNPDNIGYINVRKGAIGDPADPGTIYLTLKQSYTSFLTLTDIVRRKDPAFSERNILYIVNDSVVKDTAGIRIDPTLILNVHAVSVTDPSFLCNGQPKMGIVVIDTRPHGAAPAKDPEGSIRIRG